MTRHIAITGAGSGVGAATARLFAARGHRVALIDRDGDAVRRVAAELKGEALALQGDVTSAPSIATAFAEIDERWGRLDTVVNNAGAPHRAVPFTELDEDTWRRALDVNLLGIVHVTTAALPLLRRGDSASVVNVTSVAGVRARPGLAAYCAAKAAAISLTQTLALELAPEGIRVNAIGPGALETPMFEDFLTPGETHDEGVARYAPNIPLGRLGRPEEIAEAILWTSEPTAGFITGQTILVDGGRSL